jgi:hypothetical protein
VDGTTSDRIDALRANWFVYPFIAASPDAMASIVYLAGYLLLGWISFIEPYGNFNITPWNPGMGLSFVLVATPDDAGAVSRPCPRGWRAST